LSYQALIATTGILFGLMLITALLTRQGGVRKGNRLLAASLACMLCYLMGLIFIRQNWFAGRLLSLLPISLITLSPALLLGYVRALIQPGFALQFRDLIHLIPGAGFIAIIVIASSGDNATTLEVMARPSGSWPPGPEAYAGIIMYTIQASYFGLSIYELNLHRQRVTGDFSYEENVTLHWLRLFIGLSLFFSVAGLSFTLIRFIPGTDLWPRSFYSMSVILVLYYLVGFAAMRQPAIFSPGESEALVREGADLEKGRADLGSPDALKYETSRLTDEVTEQYWDYLQSFMDREKPFLDSKLRIADLAEKTDIPVHYLSQVINRSSKQSFFEYINGYRVDMARNTLESGNNSITTIAFDAGFNSESAFYRHFKKVTGKTPKEYQRGLNQAPDHPAS
jgi:AraC-like DNA-binding protein